MKRGIFLKKSKIKKNKRKKILGAGNIRVVVRGMYVWFLHFPLSVYLPIRKSSRMSTKVSGTVVGKVVLV